jgi:hypothetical protein
MVSVITVCSLNVTIVPMRESTGPLSSGCLTHTIDRYALWSALGTPVPLPKVASALGSIQRRQRFMLLVTVNLTGLSNQAAAISCCLSTTTGTILVLLLFSIALIYMDDL